MDDLFDDPIADLLSEGSNDSFFEDPKVKFKKSSKPVTNIFNLNDDSKIDPVKPNIEKAEIIDKIEDNPDKNMDLLQLGKSTENKERKSSFDKGDLTDLLDVQDSSKKSKASIMNEILGISTKEEPKVSNFDDIFKSSTVKREPEKKTEEIEKILLTEPRRSRRGSANLDPLGLLDIATKSPESKRKTDIKPITDNIDIKSAKSTNIIADKQADSLTKTSKSVSFLDTKEPNLTSEFLMTRGRRENIKKTNLESNLPDWLQGSTTSVQSKNIEVSAKPAVTNLHPENVEKYIPIDVKTSVETTIKGIYNFTFK